MGQVPAKHHMLIINEIQKLADGDGDRLMICMPPGSAKSTYASRLAPAWLLSQKPNTQVIGASHTTKLAEDISRQVHGYIRGHENVLGYSLETESAGLWSVTNGGRYLAAGVGSSIAGFRADCLLETSRIITLAGEISIKDIEIGTESGVVLSYDSTTGRPTFSRVKAKAARKAEGYYRICCASGSVVEATGEHLFQTFGGWKKGKELTAGEVLMRVVRSGDVSLSGRHEKGDFSGSDRVLLREDVFLQESQRANGPPAIPMPALSCSNVFEGSGGPISTLLFCEMQEGSRHTARETKADSPGAGLRNMQLSLSAHEQCSSRQVLQSRVQRQRPLQTDFRGEEPWVAARDGYVEGKRQGVLRSEASGVESRRDALRGMLLRREDRRSPHQYDPCGQQATESSHSLPRLPSEVPLSGAFRITTDTVALVERVCEPADVYDIQVEGTECFYANGILVHNCAIIDDPMRGRKSADSEVERDTAWNWFTADLRTRLKPHAKIIVIMTRWHEDDVGGRLIEMQGGRWRVLKVPAIAVENDPIGRQPGEWLWDDDTNYDYGRELREVRAEYEKSGAMRDWYSLFQQDPHPLDGSIFKIRNIAVLAAVPAGVKKTVRAWDLAATQKTGTRDPDWTTGLALSRYDDGRFLVEGIERFRGGPDDVRQGIKNTAKRDGIGVRISLPQDPGQAGKTQVLYLTRELAGFRVESSPESGDKATRAAPVASQVNVGNLSIVQADWNEPFIEELRSFPSGRHDDQVDALSRAFAMLIKPPAPARRTTIKIGNL